MPKFVSILLQGSSICLYQRKPFPNGSYRKRLNRTAPGGIPGTAIPARPAYHQYYSHSAISCRSTWQPSSEPSLPAEPVLTYGCQMGAAYSNCGRIKVLYAAAFVSLGAKVKLRRRNPRVLVAFEVISEICWPQSRLSLMVIPRYFADWTSLIFAGGVSN